MGAPVNTRTFPNGHRRKARATALVDGAMGSPGSHVCSLVVPDVLHPERMITNGEQIAEKDAAECEQERLFLGPNFSYLGDLAPKLEKWLTLVSGAF